MAICVECGCKHGKPRKGGVSTFSLRECSWCGKMTHCTQEHKYGLEPQPKDKDNE